MIRLHPVAIEEEVAVLGTLSIHLHFGRNMAAYDVKITAIIAVNFSPQSLHHGRLVQPFGNIVKAVIAERVFATLDTDVVGVLAGALVWPYNRIVAVDRCGDAGPDAFTTIA